ncbi:MAG: ThiJ/PfpI domain protein [Caulobacter sp.]|nr:ThiJ/PfpI domain protein [Caulobacter sp.]
MRPLMSLLAVIAAAFLTTPVISCAATPEPAPAAVSPDPLPLTLPAPKAGRTRPLVVVLADNAGSETTDFTIPYGVLKDSGVADVVSVSTRPGVVQLMMALKITADRTLETFDAANPAGADIVIVPAMMDGKDPAMLAWLRAQYAKGAVIVSICEGARVVARTGLLDGHAATSHWSSLKGLAKAYPAATWVRDLRYVQSGRMISTTGVTASIPVSLALIEAIAGRPAARAEADRLGVADWSPVHRTADFQVKGRDYATGLGAMAAVWNHQRVEAPLTNGMDEVTLALRADAWSRTFHGKVVSTATDGQPVRSRHGLLITPDAAPRRGSLVLAAADAPAGPALNTALADIGRRYGPRTRRLAALGLEYPLR